MAHSLDDVKRRIMSRVQLPALIGETVALQTRGGRTVGLCPFHNEKTPSFNLYDDGRYYCFGCKANGDAIEFVKLTQGMSFIDALRYLANKFGVESPELDESTRQLRQQRMDASLYTLMQQAHQFFLTKLDDPARAYLQERGFTAENIQEFGFGLTPEEPFGLVRHLRAKGFKPDDMVACSLATISTKDGRAYDFFRHRIMIPIRDSQGRIIAFGGRTTEDHPAKYMNSGATKLFDKAQTLFGLDRARKIIRERQRAVVVEGYMDAMQLWQKGLGETVACLGTAFTEWHLKALQHATSQVTLLFDGDSAGQKATLAAVSIALTVPEIRVKAVELPAGDDPDSYIRKNGLEALESLLGNAVDLLEFAIRKKLAATHMLGVPELVSKEFIPWLAQVPNRMQQSLLTVRISQLTGIPAATIEGELRPAGFQGGRHRELSGHPRFLNKSNQLKAQNAAKAAASALLPPLEVVLFDLFGHLFHASPSDLSPAQLAAMRLDLHKELDIDEPYLALLGEMFDLLSNGVSPASAAISEFPSALSPSIVKLLDKLRAAAAAFDCNDRLSRLNKVLEAWRWRKVKGSIHSLKAQLGRLAALPRSPETDAEVRQLLQLISSLSRDVAP